MSPKNVSLLYQHIPIMFQFGISIRVETTYRLIQNLRSPRPLLVCFLCAEFTGNFLKLSYQQANMVEVPKNINESPPPLYYIYIYISLNSKRWWDIRFSPIFALLRQLRPQKLLHQRISRSSDVGFFPWFFGGSEKVGGGKSRKGFWLELRRVVKVFLGGFWLMITLHGTSPYPTLGKGKSSSRVPWWGEMLVPRVAD